MRKGRFRGKFLKFYNWNNMCPETCRICTCYIDGKCCNYFVVFPGKRFYIV